MDLLRQDDLYQAIMALWPRCRMVKAEFANGAWLRLRGYGEDYVKDALKRHRAQYLDAIRPEWKTLFRELAGSGDGGSRRNDLEVLLGHVRRGGMEAKLPGAAEWSDSEAFQKYLDVNPGKRAGIIRGWREYFVDMGEPLPGYLSE